MKMFKTLCLTLCLLIICFSLTAKANTIDNTTVRFSNSLLSNQITYDNFRAPFRNENNNSLDDYTQRTSKYNQPRGVGTSPHIGVRNYIDYFKL